MPPDRAIARAASGQHGAFSRGQARRAGFSDQMIKDKVERGRWERVRRAVFRVAGAPESWRQELMSAILACPGPAVASHRSAGALWRLEGCDESVVEITVPRGRLARGLNGVIVHETNHLDPKDMTVRDGIRVTKPDRTILDLAAAADVEPALDDALRRRLVYVGSLETRLPRGGRGVGALRRLLADRKKSGPAGSGLEAKLLRVIRASGLPDPVRQHRVVVGGRAYRLDYAYPQHKVAIEFDGWRDHFSREHWERDSARQNGLELAGWLVLRFNSTDLRRRRVETAELIRGALRRVA